MENKLWYLKRSRLFERATEEMVAYCEHFFVQQLVPAKRQLFGKGDDARVVYLIKRGKVKIAHLTEDGKEVLVSLLGAGDIFGEEVIFNETDVQRTTIARALEPTLLCMARAEDIFAMVSRHPVLALNVAKYVREQRDDALAIVEEVAFLKVADRLTRLLERLADEHGVPYGDGTLLDIRVTHADLAALIGSTREAITMELSNLAKAGYLRMDGRSIVLSRRREESARDATPAPSA